MMYLNVKLDSLDAIYLAFGLSLFFSFFRIFSRLWYYASLCFFCSAVE